MSEFNARVLEALFGWRRVQAPKHDCDGPLPQQGEVLVCPSHDDKNYQWPVRGVVPFSFFFAGVPWYAFDTDANADYSVLVFVREKWNNQRLRRFRVEFAKLATPGLASGSAMFAYYQPGMYARAALAVIDSERKDRE